ncbi:MAG: hypothetical protein ABMA64_21905, partial [Myxococcota bacterium]
TWVDSDVPYDRAREAARDAQLRTWIAERVAAAKTFAALPPTWPFEAARYARTELPGGAAEFDAAAAPLRALIEPLGARPPSRVVVGRAPPLVPDGLTDPLEPLRPYLTAGPVTFFETPDEVVKRDVGECDGQCWVETRAFRVDADGRTLRSARFQTVSHYEGRSLSESTTELVLSWDAAGHLVAARVTTTSADRVEGAPEEDVGSESEEVVSLWWTGDKIAKVERRAAVRTRRGAAPFDPPVYTGHRWTPSP